MASVRFDKPERVREFVFSVEFNGNASARVVFIDYFFKSYGQRTRFVVLRFLNFQIQASCFQRRLVKLVDVVRRVGEEIEQFVEPGFQPKFLWSHFSALQDFGDPF